MRYVMRQKVFSLGDDYVIRDENGCDAFVVAGKVFALGNHLAFNDMTGNKLASIDQESPWGLTYDIRKGDQLWAVVHKKMFTFFNCQFTVNEVGQDDVLAAGNFTDHEYMFTRGGTPIARVSKQWFQFSDTYGVEVDQQGDDILILASTVVIDLCCHPRHR